MQRFIFICLLICIAQALNAQELFPYAEPASTMPKGVVGFRFTYQNYKEQTSNRIKNWYGIRFMYGITSKWTVMSTLGISNHHFKEFPTDMLNYLFNHHLNTYKSAPYTIEGINLYSKYRFYSLDQYHKHLRLSLVTELCKSFIAHDEAEPSLMTDNSGAGIGLIGTYLINRFALSTTLGYIHPFLYTQKENNITFQSGNSSYAIVSTGYRIWPATYSSYSDFNVNVYAEFTFKQYGASEITENGVIIDYKPYHVSQPYTYMALKEGSYINGRFFVQLISNSNSRIDLGIALAIKNRSYNYWSPMLTLQYQTYLFNDKKESELNKKRKQQQH